MNKMAHMKKHMPTMKQPINPRQINNQNKTKMPTKSTRNEKENMKSFPPNETPPIFFT